MNPPAGRDSAKAAYDAFASAYDDFAHEYMFERWTGRLLEKAEEAGLPGKSLLDVGCGTGLSFLPMLDRGFRVTACDISEAMLDIARAKAGEKAKLLAADMRALPALGVFDLVWAVNDSLNYLLSPEELEVTLEGFRRNLGPVGIALFDVNTLATYRTLFSREVVVKRPGRRLVWQGQSDPDQVRSGSLHEARFEAEGEAGSKHVHRQRHFSEEEILVGIDSAGLTCVGIFGELGGALSAGLDEDTHTKAVYVCRR